MTYPSLSEVLSASSAIIAKRARWRAWYHRTGKARHMAKRHAKALAAGRIPGKQGRPITSTHPRAAYWREYAKQRRTI